MLHVEHNTFVRFWLILVLQYLHLLYVSPFSGMCVPTLFVLISCGIPISFFVAAQLHCNFRFLLQNPPIYPGAILNLICSWEFLSGL